MRLKPLAEFDQQRAMIRDFWLSHHIKVIDLHNRVDKHVICKTVLFGIVRGARVCETMCCDEFDEIQFLQYREGVALRQNIKIAADDDPVTILRDVFDKFHEAFCLHQTGGNIVFTVGVTQPMHMGMTAGWPVVKSKTLTAWPVRERG